ncbi:hypothetical protein [Stenotrophomonas maltophilia]|uniref:hypothetical protein n=1 Tax=Stenotrophomonas maltophilia TaxID=40324 RepID=UPI0015F20111|nr:hypothetical protein [Stenotrophomonas maltophilia]QDY48780.1 hypothetical protein DUW70_09660 [Stenotrophomonas maltophilia]
MTDVRELLARLNPQTVKFNTGRGGVPELTNHDILGALSDVPAGLGRDLLEYGAWPDGAALRAVEISSRIHKLVMAEWSAREQAYIEAKVERGLVVSLARYHRKTLEFRTRAELDAKVDEARARRWPEKMGDRLEDVVKVAVGDLFGMERSSNRDRAKDMGMSESGYREVWASVVDWVYTAMQDAEAEAGRQMWRALNKEDAA